MSEINLTPTCSYFEIDGQNKITGRSWGAFVECKAACLLVHGLGAHSGWFEALGRRLKVRQIYALAYDQLGFGKRREQPFRSRKQWLEDLELVFRYMKEQVGDAPIFLLGNSAGALISLLQARKLQAAGLILSSPGFEAHSSSFTPWFRLKGITQALLDPDKEISLPYKTDDVTRDPGARKWIEADEDRRFSVPARVLWELLMLSKEVDKEVPRMNVPTLMLTAGVESIVDNKVAQTVFSKLAARQKRSQVFQESWHDLMFDPQLDEVAEEITRWQGALPASDEPAHSFSASV